MISKVRIYRPFVIVSTVFAFGCATQPGGVGGGNQSSLVETGGCNPALTAAAGAVIGALIAGKGNRTTGSVIGGAAGSLACVAWNYRVERLKTAEQVNTVYRERNQGQLPAVSTVVGYSVQSVPRTTLNSGEPLVIDSVISVVQGASDPLPKVEQELTLFHDGKVVSKARKLANLGQGAGEFKNRFQVDLQKGIPQGAYPVQTALYLNGVKVREQGIGVQVVNFETDNRLANSLRPGDNRIL